LGDQQSQVDKNAHLLSFIQEVNAGVLVNGAQATKKASPKKKLDHYSRNALRWVASPVSSPLDNLEIFF